MNCPVCSTEMVKAQATNYGAEYNYCRTCKKEESELIRPAFEAQMQKVVDELHQDKFVSFGGHLIPAGPQLTFGYSQDKYGVSTQPCHEGFHAWIWPQDHLNLRPCNCGQKTRLPPCSCAICDQYIKP